MKPIEVIVIIACALIVGGVITSYIIKRVQGKPTCTDCEGCAYSSSCGKRDKETSK